MNSRDLLVICILAISVIMAIWAAISTILNGDMLLDLLDQPSLHSASIFCFYAYMIAIQLFYLVMSVVIVIDHLYLGSNHIKSIIPSSSHIDLQVAIIITNLIAFGGLASQFIAFSGISWRVILNMVISFLYPMVASGMQFYYIHTLPNI